MEGALRALRNSHYSAGAGVSRLGGRGPWGWHRRRRGGSRKCRCRGHTVPVGDPHFCSRLISLPDQSDTLRGLPNMLIQAVDCTKTGLLTLHLLLESESGESLVCCGLHYSVLRWTLPLPNVGFRLPCKKKGDCQSL